MKIINKGKLPILSWCNNPDEECLKQATNLSNFPFAYPHICLMPDTHVGFGMPIGGVVGLDGVISPNMVGVDIGCGMCAVKTSLTDIDQSSLKKVLSFIREWIPLGFKHHQKKSMPDATFLPNVDIGDLPIVSEQNKTLLEQLGTLGSGNHFIEIQKGDDGHIWFMLHSGSRNLGLKVANHHNKIAIKLNEKMLPQVPKEWQLAYLLLNSNEGQLYLKEMNYCLEFAKSNRQIMALRIKEAFIEITKAKILQEVNIHHNYAHIENHFNKNLVVHRKGATSAFLHELGIIPGSQGTPSYIVEGKGNHLSFMSCSHGAGRVMGREEAKRNLNLEFEKKRLDDLGIIHAIRNKNALDEAPSAYKNIEEVMAEQQDLVLPIIKLLPLAVIKG
ncbi:MAG: RtcB family protein [Oligoflexia bacterium]|nr:RtcB family protein [Oligoflexia bacterium]